MNNFAVLRKNVLTMHAMTKSGAARINTRQKLDEETIQLPYVFLLASLKVLFHLLPQNNPTRTISALQLLSR